MNSYATIIEVDADHQVWNNELNEMKEEIIHFEKQLAGQKLVISDLDKEHFQNQFRVHRNAIEQIKNRIQKCHLHGERNGGSCFDVVTKAKYTYHEAISDNVDRQFELYCQLKKEFKASINLG